MHRNILPTENIDPEQTLTKDILEFPSPFPSPQWEEAGMRGQKYY
jgi:hypothetical protein